MAEMNKVLESPLKYRDGKKWKNRVCVVRKLSPVADRLHLSLYKDVADSFKPGTEKASLSLQDFYGIQTGFTLDKEEYVLALICLRHVTMLAFENYTSLDVWRITIREHLGEDREFPAKLLKAPTQCKHAIGNVALFIQGSHICITNGVPPKVWASWNISDFKKFGLVDEKLCLEAGSCSGKSSGVFVMLSQHHREIIELLNQVSKGRHTKQRRSNSTKHKRASMPCASTLPSSCSAPFLGVENIPRDFRDRQVQADQNFLVSEDRNPDRISRMSSQGLPTKHGDSTTTLTPSGEENEQDQSHHTNHGGSSSIYGSPSIAGSADLLSSHPPVMLKSSWFRLKPHEYTEIDDIITPDGLQNGHDNASRGIGAGAGVGHGSSDLLSASVPASQRKPDFHRSSVSDFKNPGIRNAYVYKEDMKSTTSMHRHNPPVPPPSCDTPQTTYQPTPQSSSTPPPHTLSNVFSYVINSITGKPASQSGSKSDNLAYKPDSNNTLPRMARGSRGAKSGVFESHGGKPTPTSPTRKSSELLSDILTVLDDSSSASVRDIDSIQSSTCSTGSINDSTGSASSVPQSPTNRYSAPEWNLHHKRRSKSLERPLTNLAMSVSSGGLHTPVAPPRMCHEAEKPPVPPRLDTSNKPKKSSINYNDVLRYVDFSQYDGSEETPPIPAKTPTYRTSSRSRDHHDSKISLSRGSSLGDILESSGAYDGSRFTTVPIQPLENVKDLHQEADKLYVALRNHNQNASSVQLEQINGPHYESQTDSNWTHEGHTKGNRTRNNNSSVYAEQRCADSARMMADCTSFNHFNPAQKDCEVFMTINLPAKPPATLLGAVPPPAQRAEGPRLMTRNASIAVMDYTEHDQIHKDNRIPRNSSFSGVCNTDSQELGNYLDMAGLGSKSTRSSKESIMKDIDVSSRRAPPLRRHDLCNSMDNGLEPDHDSYVDMNLGRTTSNDSPAGEAAQTVHPAGGTNVLIVEKPFDDLLDISSGGKLSPLTDEERAMCGLQTTTNKRLHRSASISNNASNMPKKSLKSKLHERLFRRNSTKDFSHERCLESDDQKSLALEASPSDLTLDNTDSIPSYTPHTPSYTPSHPSSRRGSTDLLAVPESHEEDPWFPDSNLTDEQKQKSCSSLASRPSVNSTSSCDTPPPCMTSSGTPPPCVPPRLYPRPSTNNNVPSPREDSCFRFPPTSRNYTQLPHRRNALDCDRSIHGAKQQYSPSHAHSQDYNQSGASDYCVMRENGGYREDLPLTDDYKTRHCRDVGLSRQPPPPPKMIKPPPLPPPPSKLSITTEVPPPVDFIHPELPLPPSTYSESSSDDEPHLPPRILSETPPTVPEVPAPEVPARLPPRKTKPGPLVFNKEHKELLDMRPPPISVPRAGMRSVISDGSSTPSSPDVRHSNSTTLHHSHQHHHQQCTPCGTPAQTPGHRRTSGSMSSMASSTMRPRSGREYVDRRKLDELNLNGSDDQVAPSPFSNTSSVFTFDSSMSLSLSNCSPRSPSESSYMSSRTKEPEYVNINPFTPPASPHHSIGSEVSNRRLNYAEIDLSSSGNTNSSSDRPTSRVIPSRPRGSDVHYAKIDMVAMAAASRVGREHAQFREDSLKRKDDPRRVPEDRFHHRHKTLTNSKRLSITNRSGSKDRKHSAPS